MFSDSYLIIIKLYDFLISTCLPLYWYNADGLLLERIVAFEKRLPLVFRCNFNFSSDETFLPILLLRHVKRSYIARWNVEVGATSYLRKFPKISLINIFHL